MRSAVLYFEGPIHKDMRFCSGIFLRWSTPSLCNARSFIASFLCAMDDLYYNQLMTNFLGNWSTYFFYDDIQCIPTSSTYAKLYALTHNNKLNSLIAYNHAKRGAIHNNSPVNFFQRARSPHTGSRWIWNAHSLCVTFRQKFVFSSSVVDPSIA